MQNKNIELEAIPNFLEEIRKLGTISNDSKNRYSIAFLCNFYEITKSIKILIDSNWYNSAPILLRTLVEIHYTIKNIEVIPNFTDRLAFESLNNEIRRLNALKKEGIPINEEELALYNTYYQQQSDKTPLKELTKFINIDGNESLYRTLYSDLSLHLHSSISIVFERFITLSNEKVTFNYDTNLYHSCAKKDCEIINLLIFETIISVGKINNLNIEAYEEKLKIIYDSISKLNSN